MILLTNVLTPRKVSLLCCTDGAWVVKWAWEVSQW